MNGRRVRAAIVGRGGVQERLGKPHSVDGGAGVAQVAAARSRERRLAIHLQSKADLRKGQRKLLHERLDAPGLSRLRSEKLEPGRHIPKQAAHGYRRAGRASLRRHSHDLPAFQLHLRAGRLVRRACDQRNARYRGDAGQRLAPEAHGGDAVQASVRGQLAGGKALEGKGRLLRGYAAAVVYHADQFQSAAPNLHDDGFGARVDGVVQQFLHD